MRSRFLLVTGTGTDVGKTIAAAAVAVIARERGRSVGVVKLVQTGVEPAGSADVDVIRRLAGGIDAHEVARYRPKRGGAAGGGFPVRRRASAPD